MPIKILMPALSPTMTEGNLAKWHKKEGDPIKPGDVIAEIETDKATMEVEATDEGTLGRILIPEGTADVAVNTPIATILSDGESAADLGKAPATPAPKAAEAAPAAEAKAEAPQPAPKAPARMCQSCLGASLQPMIRPSASGRTSYNAVASNRRRSNGVSTPRMCK